MNRIMRMAFAVLLCLSFALLAGGCKQEESSGVVKDYVETKSVTLSMLTSVGLSDHIWDTGFTAKDGTQINIIEYSSEYYTAQNLPYRELVKKRLESNVDIDCYTIQAEDVIAYSKENFWMDLSGLDAVKNLSEDAIVQSTYDGKVFSIPLSYTGFGFYWNVDMLNEHGLTVPQTLSEFIHVCEVLKNAGITPYLGNKGYALTVPAMVAGFADVYAADDSAEILSRLSSGETPVSEYMSKGFALIETMIKNGYLDGEYALATNPGDPNIADFLAGKGAFVCATLQDMKADFEIALTGIPVLETGPVAVVGANFRLAVNPNSPNSQYAVELLDVVVTPEWLAGIASEQHALSSGKGDYDMSYLNERYRDFAKLVMSGNQVPNQDFALSFNTWEAIRDICRTICSGTTAEQASAEYDRVQREQIAAFGK